MILIVDNYDSFVHNLARYFVQLGQETHVVRNNTIDLGGIAALSPAAVVLSPGPCSPSEAGICLELVRELSPEIPILGVCLGHQVIGQALGGEVVRAERPLHGQASQIQHHGEGLFTGLPAPMAVGRYHSLVVRRDSLPDCLRIDAETTDGVVMAICHRERPLFGVQFHPESILTEHGYDLLRRFLDLGGLTKVETPALQTEGKTQPTFGSTT
ncbi:MAG: aminodeoxychorismate/anthranilate synthase component II [Pirellulaceae bacterium]